MITLTQTESTLSLSINIRPKGYEGAEFVPEGLTVEVVGRNNGALLQHLNGNIEGDRLSVDIDLDDVQDVDIYDLVINYRLRDARYIRGYRAVNIIETAFEARRSENTSILGGGNTARATVITPVASEGANSGTAQSLDLAKLNPEQVESLKQALGINANASQGTGQVLDFASLSPEQVEALKQALETSEFYISSLTRKILSEQITMGYVYENWDTEFAEMNSVQVDGFGASSSAGLAEYIELLAKAVNRLDERVNRLEVGQ